MKQTFISVLHDFGFKKVAWNRCAKGFKESNYRCYERKPQNVWCELYLSDAIPYGWIVGDMFPRNSLGLPGKFFESPTELKQILTSYIKT